MLTFDEANHTYKIGNRRVPSVTQILTAGGAIDTTWFTPESAERGKRIHDAIHAYTEDPTLADAVGDEARPYLNAYREFMRLTWARLIQSEGLVCSKLGYAGRFDQYLEIDGQFVLIDLKTGPIQGWCAMQTAAYAMALIESGRKVDKRVGVHLDRTGTYKIETYGEMRNDFARFWTYFLRARRLGALKGA